MLLDLSNNTIIACSSCSSRLRFTLYPDYRIWAWLIVIFMLYYNTINSATLELLRQLQAIPAFSKLRLVGGTSLALQMGHRTSIDLDLFGCLEADEFVVTNALNKIGDVTILKRSENINIYTINGIKVDIVNYPYSWLLDTLVEDNLKLARGERSYQSSIE